MGKTHQNCQLPFFLFFSFFPTNYFCQNVVELVIAWKGKSMGSQIRIGKRSIFKKRVLTSLARKNDQKRKPFCHTSTFSIFQTILLHVGAFGEQLKSFLCVWISRFDCWLHFSQGLEVVFVATEVGLSSSRFQSCWCIFHSRFWKFHVFYHGCEGPFTFLTVSATIGLTYRLFGAFSSCCELCSMISFRTVCVSSYVSHFCYYVWGCVIRFSLFKL